MKKRKKLPGLDKYLIFSFACTIIFTISVLAIYIFTQSEPSTLITCFFALFGGEVVFCALIKKFKLDKQAKERSGEEGDDGDGDDSSCE